MPELHKLFRRELGPVESSLLGGSLKLEETIKGSYLKNIKLLNPPNTKTEVLLNNVKEIPTSKDFKI